MANGSRVSSHVVGNISFLHSLSIDNVLYVLGSLFNLLFISRLTRSLVCVISFYQIFCLFTGLEFRTDDWQRM